MITEQERHDSAAGQQFKRTDVRTRDLVDEAITSLPTLGVQRAASFLAAMHVPAEIAVRCLVYPHRRRALA